MSNRVGSSWTLNENDNGHMDVLMELLAEIAATNAELDAAGITLDTDPRRSTKTGQEKTVSADQTDPNSQ